MSWMQINTDSFRIIYPQPLEHAAQRLAGAVSILQENEIPEVGNQALKIDIVLHNQTTISNGFVGLAPWRSYLYTTPLQNSFESTALPWLDFLAIHEYRHILQFSNSRHGLTKWLYYLFGEEAWAGAINLAVPDWYFEGDAVWAETNLSEQGRGAVPYFMKGYRSLYMSNNLPGYTQARNNSICEFIPDHYRLGYLLVRYGYKEFGPGFWKHILQEASAYKGIFYPFRNSLEHISGYPIEEFYRRAVEDFKQEYWENNNKPERTCVVLPVDKPRTHTDYFHPGFIHGNLVYYKKNFEKTGAFYSLGKDGFEHKLVSRGISVDDYFSGRGHFLVWTELRTHPRWIEKDYREILIYDFETGRKHKLTRRGKFFSPDINESGSSIIAVQVDEFAKCKLVTISTSTGEVDRVIPNQNDWVFTYPKWDTDEQSIVSNVRNKEGQMGIIRIDLPSGDSDTLVPFRRVIIGVPHMTMNQLLFSAGSPEVENIFSLDLQSNELTRITNSSAGAFQPALYQDTLYFVEFSQSGHRIVCQPVQPGAHGPPAQSLSGPDKSDTISSILSSAPEQHYETKKYSAWAHAINFHSWGFNFESSNLVLRALSTNILNNIEFAGGLRFESENENELLIQPGSIKLNPFARISMAILYPQLDFEANTIKRSARANDRLFEWQETTLASSISVPFNLSSGTYTRTLFPWFGVDQTMARGDIRENLSSVKAGIFFLQKRIKARKNIHSRNGQFIFVQFKESIDELHARQFSFRSAWAFPGLSQNHSLIIYGDYQKENPENDYRFGDSFPFPRGSSEVVFEEILRIGADYHFPVWYPDRGFGGLIYIYRIRGNFFYDWSNINLSGRWDAVSSAGVELVFDLNILNTLPLNIGIRYSRIFNHPERINHISFFVPISRF